MGGRGGEKRDGQCLVLTREQVELVVSHKVHMGTCRTCGLVCWRVGGILLREVIYPWG